MSIKIALGTSSIELKVSASDGSVKPIEIIAGFKRFPIKEAEAKLQELDKLIKEESGDNSAVDKFISDHVIYLKNVQLYEEDEETGAVKLSELIKDTRTVKVNESLWGDKDNACSYLLEQFLMWAPWRLSFILALQKAFINRDLQNEFLSKN